MPHQPQKGDCKHERIPRKNKKAENGHPAETAACRHRGDYPIGGHTRRFAKWLDATAANTLPLLLQRMDIGNYFGRLAIWFLLGTAVSVYSASPLRAGINTFCFFISMVAGYYLYCHYVLGFLPRSYMMIWVLMSFASFFLAMVCWYAKGEGAPAVLLSAVILGALLAQAVNLRIDRGFYVYHLMEVFTWLAGVLLLRRRGKEFAVEMGLSVVVAVLYQLILPHWG